MHPNPTKNKKKVKTKIKERRGTSKENYKSKKQTSRRGKKSSFFTIQIQRLRNDALNEIVDVAAADAGAAGRILLISQVLDSS